MKDIQTIPDEELYIDLEETQEDISLCGLCLSRGITFYGGRESVEDRMFTNEKIEAVIIEELKRRGVWEKYNDNSR